MCGILNAGGWTAEYVSDISEGLFKEVQEIQIDISTIENSAWKIKIDLKETTLKKLSAKKLEEKKSKYNWFVAEIKNQKFIAKGDFTKLSFLIGKFRSLIGETKSNYHHRNDYFFDIEIQNFILENNDD